MTELALARLSMESNLRAALQQDRLTAFYQIQVDTRTGRISGIEALVRWKAANGSLILPGDFIPVAESTGLITQVDRSVMRKAMTQVIEWREMGLETGRLSVNCSIKHLQQADFVESLSQLLQETGFKPEWLELEVTESQIMERPEQTIEMLTEITRTGISLAMDDFGTGYSALSYLKRLPINRLKIDRSFITGLPEDEEDVSITRAIIALGKSLNLDLIAEGVDALMQQQFLLENGCHHIQGYLYSKPLPAEEVEPLLRAGTITPQL
jgi:EAL domain-containing protein (putative c-di-GMP-specific phosphodiesterase class I)